MITGAVQIGLQWEEVITAVSDAWKYAKCSNTTCMGAVVIGIMLGSILAVVCNSRHSSVLALAFTINVTVQEVQADRTIVIKTVVEITTLLRCIVMLARQRIATLYTVTIRAVWPVILTFSDHDHTAAKRLRSTLTKTMVTGVRKRLLDRMVVAGRAVIVERERLRWLEVQRRLWLPVAVVFPLPGHLMSLQVDLVVELVRLVVPQTWLVLRVQLFLLAQLAHLQLQSHVHSIPRISVASKTTAAR